METALPGDRLAVELKDKPVAAIITYKTKR